MASVQERAGDIIRRELAPILFALFIFLFIRDAIHNRLGSSNGRFISFVDTVRSVAQYRSGLPGPYQDGDPKPWRMLVVLLCSFLVKFASSTLVSIIFGKVPVILQGPRHLVSFLLGFGLLWFTPGDQVFSTLKSSRAVRLLLGLGGGLYKMRKAIFAVEAATTAQGGLALAVLVSVLSVDGTTLTRRGMHWLKTHLAAPTRTDQNPILRRFSGDITFGRFCKDSSHGARQALLSTVLPLGAVTALVWSAAGAEWTSGITDDSFLGLRAALLTLFIWRAGAFNELSLIHTEGMALAESVENLSKVKVS